MHLGNPIAYTHDKNPILGIDRLRKSFQAPHQLPSLQLGAFKKLGTAPGALTGIDQLLIRQIHRIAQLLHRRLHLF